MITATTKRLLLFALTAGTLALALLVPLSGGASRADHDRPDTPAPTALSARQLPGFGPSWPRIPRIPSPFPPLSCPYVGPCEGEPIFDPLAL